MAQRQRIILVAEDNVLINALLYEILREEGYQVISCFTGEEVFRVIQQVVPDVVLLDMQLETRDAGSIVLMKMRAMPETMHISTIIVSADPYMVSTNRLVITACHAEMLLKPFDVSELLDKTQRFRTRP